MADLKPPRPSYSRPMALVDKYFSYWVIGIILVIGLLGYVFLIGPKYAAIQGVGLLEFTSKQQQLEQKKQELARLEQLARDFFDLNTSELQRIEEVLPKSPKSGDLFAQFEVLANRSEVQLNSISVNKGDTFPVVDAGETDVVTQTPALQSVGVLDINIKVASLDSYDKLKVFLDNIEKNMRLVDLTSLQYLTESEQDTYSLNLKAYYLYEQ